MALAVAAVVVAVVLLALRSRLSFRMQAVRDDEDAARQFGVRTFRVKLIAFAVSAGLMAGAGSIQALNQGIVQPAGGFGLGWTIDIVAVAIIGGIGTRFGPWIGAAFLVALEEVLRRFPEVHLIIIGAILVLVIRFLPDGIWGTASKAVLTRWRRR